MVSSIDATLIAAIVGCDRDAGSPAAATPSAGDPSAERQPATTNPMEAANREPTALSRRPTTQQLAEGATKVVPVSVVPLNVRVPESWELVTVGDIGGLLTLEGWAPNGYVQLRMAARQSIPVDTFDGFVKSAEADAKSKGDKLKKFQVRPGDPMTIIERQIAGDRGPMPHTDEHGNMVDREATPLRWSYLVFLKKENKYDGYELWFDALSLEQYEQDREFLQKIMDSLTYDASRKQ
jgi:hypothetical protein